MKKTMARLLACILVLSILLPALISCAGKPAEQSASEAPNAISDEATDAATTEEVLKADVPDVDMNGKKFTFLTSGWGEEVWIMNDIVAEEENGDPVNDAKYRRNRAIEERFNCEIADYNTMANDPVPTLKKTVLADDKSYDFFEARLHQYLPLARDGLILNLYDIPHMDLTKPWWDQNSVKSLSVANKLYAVTSDITIMDNDATSAFVFNKGMITDYGLDSPYQAVKDGTWTLDALEKLVKTVSKDVDGNGTMDENDMYGLLYQRDTMTAFLAGGGEFIARKDANDLPYISLNEQKSVDIVSNLLRVLYDKTTCMNVMIPFPTDFNPWMSSMFASDRALFMWIRMVNVVALRAMETDFGILPIPKYNAEQGNYYSAVNPWTGACITVPASNTDLENSGIFLEAFAAESRYTLQPAYYDILLNGKVVRDQDSKEMLDIIFDNRVYDIGDIGRFGDLHMIIYMTMDYDSNVVSYIEKRLTKANRDIEKLIDGINQ